MEYSYHGNANRVLIRISAIKLYRFVDDETEEVQCVSERSTVSSEPDSSDSFSAHSGKRFRLQ